jgi:hypothetical protein
MSIYLLIQLVCLGLVLASFPVTAYFLAKTRRYNKITMKLRAHEPLTEREQRLLDRARP